MHRFNFSFAVLRRVGLALGVIALLVNASALARGTAVHYPVRQADGTLIYLYGAAWPIVDAPTNVTVDIQIGDDEQIATNPVKGDDQGQWQITATHGYGGHVYVQPLKSGLFTNVRIETTMHRRYVVFLRSVAAISHPEAGLTIRWHIPVPPTPKPLAVAPLPQVVVPTPTPIPDDPLDLLASEKVECNGYRWSGRADFAPIRICTDDVRTFIQIPDVADIPVLFERNGRRLVQINYGFRSNYYVVHEQYKGYALIFGTGHERQEIDIERN